MNEDLYIKQLANISGPYIGLCFSNSRSSNFHLALNIARRAPNFIANTAPGNNPFFAAVYPFSKKGFMEFIFLFNLVHNWKSVVIFTYNGVILKSEVQQRIYCFQDKVGDPHSCIPSDINPFGCNHLGFDNYSESPWYTFGDMMPTGIFVVNKELLKDKISQLFRSRLFCPDLDEKLVLSQVDSLPDNINPSVQREWEYVDWDVNGDKIPGVNPSQHRNGQVGVRIEFSFAGLDSK